MIVKEVTRYMLKPHMIGRNGQRGRPRRVESADGSLANVLRVRREVEEDVIKLHLSGTIDLANLLILRDAAFTAIGERPRLLCIDIRTIGAVEIGVINTLVTISRVARMVGVNFALLPSLNLHETLVETGLIRVLPSLPSDTQETPEAPEEVSPSEMKSDSLCD